MDNMFSKSVATFRLHVRCIGRVEFVRGNVAGSQSVLEGVKSLDFGRWIEVSKPLRRSARKILDKTTLLLGTV